MKWTPRLVGAGAIVLSCLRPSPTASAEQATAACYALWIRSVDPPASSPRGRNRPLDFSASEVLDLELSLLVAPNRIEGRNVELKLFTPKGHLYQTLTVPLHDRGSSGATSRAQLQFITAKLPVAGTTIVNSSLYGTWKAEAYVEGDASPCSKSRQFVIRP